MPPSSRVLTQRPSISRAIRPATQRLASTRMRVGAVICGLIRAIIAKEEALLTIQLGDLRALKAEACHQALLIEDEGVDIVLQGGCGQ